MCLCDSYCQTHKHIHIDHTLAGIEADGPPTAGQAALAVGERYGGVGGAVPVQYGGQTEGTSDKVSEKRGRQSIAETGTQSGTGQEQPRKKAHRRRRMNGKRVSRACNHCQKAHVTCNESRPCERCVARNMADTCRDAPRKAKKYLLEDLQEAPGVSRRACFPVGAPSRPLLPPGGNFDTPDQYRGPRAMDAANGTTSSRSQSGNFLSSAADLEYSVLGSIVSRDGRRDSDSSHSHSGTATPTQRFSSPDDFGYLNYQPLMQLGENLSQNEPNQSQNQGQNQNQGQGQGQIQGHGQNQGQPFQQLHPHPQSSFSRQYGELLHTDEPKCDPSTNQYFIGTISTMDGVRTYSFPDVVKGIARFKSRSPAEFRRRNRRSAISFAVSVPEQLPGDVFGSTGSRGNSYGALADFRYSDGRGKPGERVGDDKANRINASANSSFANDPSANRPSANRPSPNRPSPNSTKNVSTTISSLHPQQVSSPSSGNCGLLFKEPSEIYSHIKTPFPYVRPYHDLNLYLRRRFDRRHLMSMSMSIAEYRPSFIAGMIHLKEDDLIFAEQCFQRTLLEYDNYISISGTPTLVWRRTSQIAYVGDEFCILTGWTKQELLGKSTFAVEIMDDKSCVEYFRLFSKISFGDFRGATMTECTLLTPKHESIRTSCVWTLKRDVFGIPMMIIANFLPILT